MPAKAGIQCRKAIADWTPAFAVVTRSNIIVPHQQLQTTLIAKIYTGV